MDIRYGIHPEDAKNYTTEKLRKELLIQNLFEENKINMIYSHVDRMITGGVSPVEPVILEGSKKELGSSFFLERREIGIINIGPKGKVIADGEEFIIENRQGLYIGMGTKSVVFESCDSSHPAKFYFNSAPAHKSYPTVKIDKGNIQPNHLGSLSESNERTINKYIHPEGVQSCQLVMGMTSLEPGNMWNTMPCHTHERRMEVYLYFDLLEDAVVFHLMGTPQETRHIVMRNEQAVISPSWSIHSGVGTRNYTFIWGMAGENQEFSDMDNVAMKDLK
jgi:4-deoxy-L-threo-5-hexosulose-uronate ketol-isomerase